jgi:hypothetical protein
VATAFSALVLTDDRCLACAALCEPQVEKPLNAVKPETRTSPRDLLRTCLAAQRARALSTTLDSGRMLDAVLLPR